MDVFSLVLLALHSMAGGISVESIAGWCGCNVMSPIVNSSNFLSVEVGLAMYNSSMLVETKFDDLHGSMMMYPAGYGYNYSDDGRFNTNASMDDYDERLWFGAVTGNLQCGLSFLAMMAILGALVAWNILSLNVLAVIGGQESFVTVLNLIFGVFFCLKQYRRQQYAWKKKSRLEQSRVAKSRVE